MLLRSHERTVWQAQGYLFLIGDKAMAFFILFEGENGADGRATSACCVTVQCAGIDIAVLVMPLKFQENWLSPSVPCLVHPRHNSVIAAWEPREEPRCPSHFCPFLQIASYANTCSSVACLWSESGALACMRSLRISTI